MNAQQYLNAITNSHKQINKYPDRFPKQRRHGLLSRLKDQITYWNKKGK